VTPRQHTLVLTTTPKSNGKSLRIRCTCMSQVGSPERFFNYDHLGDAPDIEHAVAVWTNHVSLTTKEK